MSRETRQLLTAALLAVVSLWVLARIRFPDQPASPSSLQSILSPFAAVPRFANLASEISDLQDRLIDSWVSVPVSAIDQSGDQVGRQMQVAIRARQGQAVALLAPGYQPTQAGEVIASDAATGLTVFRIEGAVADGLPSWTPPGLDRPRYFMMASATRAGVSLQPVFVASLVESRSLAWSGPIWLVTPPTAIEAGTAIITTDGELVGLATDDPRGRVIVPADVLLADAAQLVSAGVQRRRRDLGVEVTALTPALIAATGSTSGIVVTWVAPRSVASGHVEVGDVIESVDDHPIASVHDWQVLTARLTQGRTTFRVRRHQQLEDVAVTLGPAPETTSSPVLGLDARSSPDGVLVVGVAPGTAASAAGLKAGDLITRADDLAPPSSAQLSRRFDALAPGQAMLLAFTRDDAHHVVGLVK